MAGRRGWPLRCTDANRFWVARQAAKAERYISYRGELEDLQLHDASHKFLELQSKLRAFELLVEQGNHERAAVVADDLLQLIEHFDPRTYFPELFVQFSALFSTNIGLLEQHWERRESMAWKALDQFYRVDLKKFVAAT